MMSSQASDSSSMSTSSSTARKNQSEGHNAQSSPLISLPTWNATWLQDSLQNVCNKSEGLMHGHDFFIAGEIFSLFNPIVRITIDTF